MLNMVIAWLLSLMVLWSPPERRAASFLLEAQETREQALERYTSIARAAAEVAFDETEKPLFKGESGRSRTALMMLTVAFFESGFRRDVDLGIGRFGKGDGGRSWCLMQMNLGNGTVPDPDPVVGSWSGKDLVADRKKCFRAGLHVLRRSFASCPSKGTEGLLNVYASGSCDKGEDKSYARMKFYLKNVRR